MANELAWLYILIFLAIPLSRMLPRIIRKLRANSPADTIYRSHVQNPASAQNPPSAQNPASAQNPPRPKNNDMLVLGQMIAGAKTFESIQRYTGLSNQKLDSILQNLESKEMITVRHIQGLLGQKVQIMPTSKGLREFHN